MHIPITLEDALRAGRVIPFVGAGVSMAVLDRGTSQPLFPSWAELLRRAADRLEHEHKAPYAAVVRNLLQFDTPEYLEAARRAREGLGPVWFTFLREHLDYPRERADDASLRLAQSLWALRSPLLITTNYDRVLQWACPRRDDLVTWDIEAPAEQVEALRGEVRRPTVWHLHGQIHNVAHLILTPDGYRRLYPDDRAVEGRYQAALATLRSLLTSKVFLFVGFSLDDDYVTHQLRSIEDLFQGAPGPHYVLVPESARDRVARLQVPVEVLTFPGFGAPLLECLDELGTIATRTSTPIEVPARLSGLPGEWPQPSAFDPHNADRVTITQPTCWQVLPRSVDSEITMSPDETFDVFLSHAHSDAETVEKLGIRLNDEAELTVWLDKWVLVPGEHWQQEMARGLDQAKTCAICIGAHTPKGWFREEIERALNKQVRDNTFRVIPVILPGGDQSLIDSFLELRTWVDFKNGIHDPHAFHILVSGIRGTPPGRNPSEQRPMDATFSSFREKLVRLQVLRQEHLIDDSVAIDIQRKLVERYIEL